MSDEWEMSPEDILGMMDIEPPAITMVGEPDKPEPEQAPDPTANLVHAVAHGGVTHAPRDIGALVLWAAAPDMCDVAALENMRPSELARACTQALMRGAARASGGRIGKITSAVSNTILPRLLTTMRAAGNPAGEREVSRVVAMVLRAYTKRLRELDALTIQAPVPGALTLVNDKPTTIAYDAFMRIFAERGDNCEFRVELPRQREVAIGCKDFEYVRYDYEERRWMSYDWDATHHALQRALESNAYVLQVPGEDGPQVINPKLGEAKIKSACDAFNKAMKQGRGIAGSYHDALTMATPAVVFQNTALVVKRDVDEETGRVTHNLEPRAPGPDIGNLFSYSFDYDPAADVKAPAFDAALARWFPEETEKWARLMYRIIGIQVFGLGTHFKRAFVFVGGRGSGKSTLTQCIIGMLPSNSHTIVGGELDIARNPLVSNVSLEEFTGQNSRTRMAGKIVNYSDELEGYPEGVASMAKRIISGSPVSGKVLYRDIMDFTPRALHLFACNDLPHQSGGDDALLRDRFIVIPMDQRIRDTAGDDPNLVETVLGERSAILHRAIKEIRATLLRPRSATWCDLPTASRAAQAQWVAGNHYLTMFLDQCTQPSGKFDPELRASNRPGCWDYRNSQAGASSRNLLSWANDWFAQMYPRKSPPDYLSNHATLARELERIGYIQSKRTRRWPIEVDEALVQNPAHIGLRKPFGDVQTFDDGWEEIELPAPLDTTLASESAIQEMLEAPSFTPAPAPDDSALRATARAMGPYVAAHVEECYEVCGTYDPTSDDNRGAWDTLDKAQGTSAAKFKGTFVPWLDARGYTKEAAALRDLGATEATRLVALALEGLGWQASKNYGRYPLNKT